MPRQFTDEQLSRVYGDPRFTMDILNRLDAEDQRALFKLATQSGKPPGYARQPEPEQEGIPPPDGAPVSFLKPGDAPRKIDPRRGDIGKIPPKDVLEWIARMGITGASFMGGLPGVLPGIARQTAIQGTLGATDALVRGDDPTSGAAQNAAMAGTSEYLGKALPRWGNKAALKLGLGGGELRDEIPEIMAALERQQKWRGMRAPDPVGLTSAWEASKKRAGKRIGEVTSRHPEELTRFDKLKDTSRRLRANKNVLGADAPLDLKDNLQQFDEKWYDQTADVLREMHAPRTQFPAASPSGPQIVVPPSAPTGQLPPAQPKPGQPQLGDGTTPPNWARNVGSKLDPYLNMEDLQKIRKEATHTSQNVLEARIDGTMVPAASTPGSQARLERSKEAKEVMRELALRVDPDGKWWGDISGAWRDFGDRARIEEASRKMRAGLMFGATRAGVGAGVGGFAGTEVGMDRGTAVGLGGLLGLVATPTNVSRAGLGAGMAAKVAPSTFRGANLFDAITTPPEKKPVKRREPK